MNPPDFVNWLDGYLTAIPTNQLAPIHVKVIKEKLDSVFNKVTPQNNPVTTTYPNYDIYCGGLGNYTMVDNGDKPSGIVWSGKHPTPYLGTQFNNFITC